MADWVSCGGCGLKHQQRADGVCPRCKQPVDGGGGLALAAAPAGGPYGAVAAPAPVAAGVAEDVTGLGSKLAGAVFIANLLVGLLALAKLGGRGSPSLFSLFIDGYLGFKLLSGNDERAKSWSTVRVILGAVVFGALNFFLRRNPADGILQLCFSGALLGLLLGEAGKARAWISLAVAVGVLLLTVVGLMALDPAALR